MWGELGLRLHVEELAFKKRRDMHLFVSGRQEEKVGTHAG